ncbi:winged helix-turn-helix domain-containing protein [Agreia sp.]|uniref:winged helix-turn-helix domain-containing protein n=1 Tax=Agreia sp. TaxID=1872416 RepID=UPI0035BB9F47
MSTSVNEPTSIVPIWPALVIPVLTVLSNTGTLHRKDLFDAAADVAGLGTDARSETLGCGGYRYEQRLGWALSNVLKAGWVDRPSRGYYAINDAGRHGLQRHSGGFVYAQAREFFAPF